MPTTSSAAAPPDPDTDGSGGILNFAIPSLRRITGADWLLLAAAIAAAVALLLHPLQAFPAHPLSMAPLPVLAVALLGGPLVGVLAATATAAAAVLTGTLTGLLALLLLAAPVLSLAHARNVHPAYACLLTPLFVSAVDNVLVPAGADRIHFLTIDLLQSFVNVVCAFGLALVVGVRRPRRGGGWAGRPLNHRLFVTLATVATLLTVGLGLLSASNNQQRQVQTAFSNLRLLSLEISDSSQVLLRAHGRALAAFGRSLTESNLDLENDDLTARLAAFTSTQAELLTVLVAKTDGDVIAAAATRPALDTRSVLDTNVSDREYFRGAIAQGAPFVSDTFRGRGFGSDMIVGISAPIYRANDLVGVIEGSLNLQHLAQVLDSASSRRGLEIILVDRLNRVVAARGSAPLATGQLYVPPEGSLTDTDSRRLGRLDLRGGALLAASARLEPYGWMVHVMQPASSLVPALELQFRTVVRDMVIALLCVFALSILFADVIARPLGEFGSALTDDAGPGGRGLLRAVRTAPREIRNFALVLVRAQRRQRRSLLRQQQLVQEKDRLNRDLQRLNVELDQIVEARTRVLAERERQLRSSETRWRTMAEIAPDAVVVIDEDNVIQFVNTTMVGMTGRSADELVGKRLETLIPERLRRGHWNGLQRYLSSNTRRLNWRSTEAMLLAQDGTERPVEIAFGEYTFEGRRYFAGYLRDIAARKLNEAEMIRARDMAEAANRAKDSFLATMSHEIRTPLHGLIGTLDLLARDVQEPGPGSRLKIARNSARALLQVANDVLDLSGIEAGHVRIERVAFDLRDLVAGVSTSFEAAAAEKSLRLGHEIAADVPGWVEGDPLRLRQIIANLLNNAIKFTARGGVSLAVRRGEDDQILFDVADTGIGVPLDKREHIFNRFAQADDERTRRFGGAGLGLAISRPLARAMGGDLSLVQTGPLGSTFRLVLPLPLSQAEPEGDPGTTTLLVPRLLAVDPSEPPRILVVDDNPANRYVVEAYLQELGIAVVLAEGADAGIAALRRGKFDLVLMDVQMPGRDGYQATQYIRSQLGLGSIPIVAMTANANIGERTRCEAAGMNDLLVKPFEMPALVELLNRILPQPAGSSPHAVTDASRPVVSLTEPLLDASSPQSVVQRFSGRPATLRKLYTALQESIAMHLGSVRRARTDDPAGVAPALHGLKGAAGMYGAVRLQVAASALEGAVVEGARMDELAGQFDQLDAIGRDTADAVQRLLESLAAAPDPVTARE